MSRTNRLLSREEYSNFDTTIHLFATNILANNNNKYMLQALAIPITWYVTTFNNGSDAQQYYEHQVEKTNCYVWGSE